jgi:outer membrane protein
VNDAGKFTARRNRLTADSWRERQAFRAVSPDRHTNPHEETTMRTPTLISLALLSALAAGTASAEGFTATLGYENSHPTGNNGSLNGTDANVDSDWAATGSLGYNFDNHWSADFWTGLNKFQHTVSQAGVGDVARVEERPMALTANYHFMAADSKFNPYLGIGYGWVDVSGEKGLGPLAGDTIKASNSSGLSYVLGADVALNDNVFLRGSARRLDFNSDVTINGAAAGNVKVDPWVYGLSVGYKF